MGGVHRDKNFADLSLWGAGVENPPTVICDCFMGHVGLGKPNPLAETAVAVSSA